MKLFIEVKGQLFSYIYYFLISLYYYYFTNVPVPDDCLHCWHFEVFHPVPSPSVSGSLPAPLLLPQN